MKVSFSSTLVAVALVATLPLHAASLNLTAPLASGLINGAYFTNTDVGSTGTGVISSFVRVQDNGIADGYNATARPVMTDVNTSPTFTHDLQLIAVPIVVNPTGAPAGSYYEFLLDINQTAANPLLSLDSIDIYTRSTALATAALLSDLTAAPSVLRYSLDTGGQNEILLNYVLNSGSGSGDLFAYIPVSYFAGALSTDYVYFYSMFGAKGGDYAENDGFEEWAVRTPTTPSKVPDGGVTVILLGGALLTVGMLRRRIS
ncbi:MAG: hypothetical protein ABIZ04_03790 [Opitutus sp.]